MLKPDQWPRPRDLEEARMVDDVKCRGAQAVITPFNRGYTVSDYVHSVGFFANFGQPEVIIMGVSAVAGTLILTELRRRISQGMVLKENEVVEGLIKGLDFVLARVDLHDALDHVDWLLWFYTSIRCKFPLMQALWADAHGCFPTEAECDQKTREAQTVKRFLEQAEPNRSADASSLSPRSVGTLPWDVRITKTPALRNAVEMSELHQKFEVPSFKRRFNLAAGDSAKVCVAFGERDGIAGERFWVDITAASAGCYQGSVANELENSASHGLHFGDFIAFDHRHIYEVVLQSEIEDIKRTTREETTQPGFRNVTQKPFDENQS